jgi:hypothetical protein
MMHWQIDLALNRKRMYSYWAAEIRGLGRKLDDNQKI